MGSHPVAAVQYSTHIHTNNTENDTKQTILTTTQKLGRLRAVPGLCGFTLAFALQLRKKNGKPSVRVVIHKHAYRWYEDQVAGPYSGEQGLSQGI